MIKVLVVDRDNTRCLGSMNALSREPDVAAIEFADDVDEALDKLTSESYSVAFVSAATLTPEEVVRLSREVVQGGLGTKVLVTDAPRSEEAIVRFVEAGACGYVRCGEPRHKIVENLRLALNGEAVLCPDVAAAIMSRIAELASIQSCFAARASEKSAGEELTPREWEVLGLLQQGRSNREIAAQLVIEIGTVKNHVHNLLSKLGASSRHEACTMVQAPEPYPAFEYEPVAIDGAG